MAKNETNAYDDLDNPEMEKPVYGKADRHERVPYDQEFTIAKGRVTQVIEKDGEQEHSDWKGFVVEFIGLEQDGLEGTKHALLFQEAPEILAALKGKVKTKEAKAAIVKRAQYNYRSFAAACSGKQFNDPKLKVLGVMRKLAEMTISGGLEEREITFAIRCVKNGKFYNTEIGAVGDFPLPKGAKSAKPKTTEADVDGNDADADDDLNW